MALLSWISFIRVKQAEELKQAVLVALDEKMGLRRGGRVEDSKLRAAAEAIQYEDWAIDFNLVCVLVTFVSV